LRLDVCVPLGDALFHELQELEPCLILCHDNIVAPALGRRNDFKQQSPTTSQQCNPSTAAHVELQEISDHCIVRNRSIPAPGQ
jgi:hypothetical protein